LKIIKNDFYKKLKINNLNFGSKAETCRCKNSNNRYNYDSLFRLLFDPSECKYQTIKYCSPDNREYKN
jgi:hypothetical protein